ncbi:unnamed protein product, partial [Musa acuminata subsp. burmannicoides]
IKHFEAITTNKRVQTNNYRSIDRAHKNQVKLITGNTQYRLFTASQRSLQPVNDRIDGSMERLTCGRSSPSAWSRISGHTSSSPPASPPSAPPRRPLFLARRRRTPQPQPRQTSRLFSRHFLRRREPRDRVSLRLGSWRPPWPPWRSAAGCWMPGRRR